MINPLRVLESSISDVGVWNWWTANFPKILQVEFSHVHLYSKPDDAEQPPSNSIAIRFSHPKCVAFMSRRVPGRKVPARWPELLAKDRLKLVPTVDRDGICLTGGARSLAMLDMATKIDYCLGSDAVRWSKRYGSNLVLWAGPVGLFVASERRELVDFAGRIPMTKIPAMHDAWWKYWRRYWRKIGTSKALPYDPTCEIVIPSME